MAYLGGRRIEINRLIIVSNRIPEVASVQDGARSKRSKYARGSVGGLVTAIYPALQERGGIWLGWSGRTTTSQLTMVPRSVLVDKVDFLSIDLTESEVENYYSGFSNRTLWPLVHSFPTKVRMRDEEYKSYQRVNQKFAEALYPYLRAGDMVWVQDYHLIPLGMNLRQLGWSGPIGFFLHTPFPPSEIFWILPWARQILDDFLRYDLVGFHTERFRQNFESSLLIEFEGTHDDHTFRRGSERLRTGVYPIGIDSAAFHEWAVSPKAIKEANSVKKYIGDRRLILGVDRLDYTKGIVERLKTFERLLDRFPSWKRKVSMIQISAPSRTRINEYMKQKRQVEMIVGEINGRLADSDWVPISYLYRAYDQQALAGFYRMADVCLVSPLRDGMNLVAKEYVASQSSDPGALVLSRFCGAADDLKEAIIVNPYDLDGTARALQLALEMPQAERKSRWISLMERVVRNSAEAWRDRFLANLTEKELDLPAEKAGIGSRLLDGIVPPVSKDKPTDLLPGDSRIGR